jgi:hypothetical protein
VKPGHSTGRWTLPASQYRPPSCPDRLADASSSWKLSASHVVGAPSVNARTARVTGIAWALPGVILVARSKNLESTCYGNRHHGRNIYVELRQTLGTGIGSDGDGDAKRRLNFQRNHNQQFDFFDFASGRERRIPYNSDKPGGVGAIWRGAHRKCARSSTGKLKAAIKLQPRAHRRFARPSRFRLKSRL